MKEGSFVLYNEKAYLIDRIVGNQAYLVLPNDTSYRTGDFHDLKDMVEITKDVADLIMTSNPDDYWIRYRAGWSDPRGIFR